MALMGILADSGLLLQAQPALFGSIDAEATEGASVLFKFVDCVNASGDPIDMSALEGVCTIWRSEGVAAREFVYSGMDDGTFDLVLTPNDSAGLAAGAQKRSYRWGMFLTDTSGDLMHLWTPAESTLTIHTAD